MKQLTIFTPTYNRAYTLSNCYNALLKQTCKDFIWMIVDDGSTDNTKELVYKFKKEKKIEIMYIYKENGGKYTAVNTGILNCKTELFSFVDSDDYYLPNTVELFLNTWHQYADKKIAGIVGRRCKHNGEIVGNLSEYNSSIVNFTSFSSKHGYVGDTCRMYKTDILKQNLYPIIDNKFIPENVMFGKIDEKYNIYFLNTPLSVSEYLEDGYTTSYKKLLLKNPIGYKLSLEQSILNEKKLFNSIKFHISYITWCKRNKLKINIKHNYIYLLSYPLSLICLLLGIPRWHTPKKGFLNKIYLYKRLLFCYLYTFNGIKVKIFDDKDTIKVSNFSDKSIIRFGDGEFNLIQGEDITYQNYSNNLKEKLLEIINNYNYNDSKYLLCIPKYFFQISGFKLLKKKDWISSWTFSRYYFKKYCDINKQYGDAFLFYKGNENNYSKLWQNNKYKKCIFVHNSEKYATEFEKKYGIKTYFVKAPDKNAYQNLMNIEHSIMQIAKNIDSKDIIIIASIGPAAKVLVYDLSDKYRVIDAGHCFDYPLNKGE